MKVLVTGAGGQLGQALARACPPAMALLALDRAALDIADPAAVERVFATENPALVINAAAYTAVDAAESEPEAAERINAAGPGVLAAACARHGARLVHVSTDYVFDGEACAPYLPGAPTNPLGVYGASKRRGELAVADRLGEAGLIVRTAWLYGATGRNFVTRMLELHATRTELSVVVDQIGAPTSVEGLARVLWRLSGRRATGVCHWVDSGVASWYDFAVAIGEEGVAAGLLDRAASVRPILSSEYPTPARRPHYSVLDKTSTEELAGERAPHWRVALRAVLASRAADRA